jgi:hypothetical protein
LDGGSSWTDVANDAGTRVDGVAGWAFAYVDRATSTWYLDHLYVYDWTVPDIVGNIINNALVKVTETAKNGAVVSSTSRQFTIFKMGITERVKLYPATDEIYAKEDVEYKLHYWATGGTNIVWTFKSNASWLSWNATSHNISGTPDNGDVGSYWVCINASFGTLKPDEHNFTLTVNNTPPDMAPMGVLSAVQDKPFSADCNSSDDGQGTVTWHLRSDTGTWLSINSATGALSGTPHNADVGLYYVNVSVDDGNGGWNFTNVTLTVMNVNDPPKILGTDVTVVYEDAEYASNYSVTDPDVADKVFGWTLSTNASWLYIATTSGKITGLPFNSDVGSYWVNVTVKDPAGLLDFRNFTLTVLNINDPPAWVTVPSDATINDTDTYNFTVKATDIDVKDELNYHISSNPASTISIGAATGAIVWKPTLAGNYKINISATDKYVSIYHDLQITVLHIVTNTPPLSTLAAPDNGSAIEITNPTLKWIVSDKDADNVITDLYLGKDLSLVQNLDISTRVASKLTTISFVPANMLEKGSTYYWTVIPYDGTAFGKCTSGTWSFSIAANASVNHLPKFVSEPSLEAGVGVEWAYTPTAIDADLKDTVTIRLVMGPDGMSMSEGTLRWTPGAPQVGKHTVKIEATDGMGSVFQEFVVEATMTAPTNHPPTIASLDPVSVSAGQTISVHVIATDQDNDTLSYSIVGAAPQGVEMNALGQLSWKTKAGDEGVYDVIIMVSDGRSSQTRSIRITVEKTPDKKVDNNGGLGLMFILIAIVAAVSAIITVFLLMRRKGQKEHETEAAAGQRAHAADIEKEPPMPDEGSAPVALRPVEKEHVMDGPSASKDEDDGPGQEPEKVPITDIRSTSIDIDDLED